MNNTYSKSEQNEQSPISPSLRLGLTAAILTTIADGIAAIAVLTAMDEVIIETEKEKQDQKELDEKLEKMQQQIDKLTNVLTKRGMRTK
ncbi:hypothetical protein [Peribacillus simplex]|uniref:Translation initiation factor 2 n=2 Tax=Peribacillus simplex TaxID=1478 RepID=A0A223EMQ3_9BACI|nr:hypothetical protein [Peribacillus simplex]ASS96562.1 hypothetical protein BS1321_23220 [Peribacillus simplex NBRC 15720 = DSM 1321]MEC1397723.1 hypothetical protein [Peribacillus simplex]MED3910865.1 hypothetical protein [Peribacillus simplex]TVX81180.1 hypothetical protein FQP34_09315 [Peribacillus simplex]